ncbi:MAG: hypothetical protein CNIPEHKO_03470 [Anaerolineales bacterium]|nr:hypothetical protein [Anaerolineae bacterium]MBL8107662.1 hypothetical protein [Anaerolineales bacterium]MBV6403139.1 hypothetical protein [Anaerolineales bacterium]MCC7190035.1 hypothetical protein [Anaerolineales bacterium]
MTQSSPKREKPFARLMRIVRGDAGQTARTRAYRRANATQASAPVPTPPASDSVPQPTRILRAFWTFTGILSLIVNIVLIAILLVALRLLGALQLTANDQFSGVLGGLYLNFVRMDEATISTNIPVNAAIPLDIVVPVKTTTRIVLADATTINNAHVVINTGGVDIDADAVVTLPAGTPLNVILDFPLPVKTDPNNNQIQVPISLNVPVDIPLKDTQLHEPFVGLQEVVKPYFCLVEPNAVWNGIQICSSAQSP